MRRRAKPRWLHSLRVGGGNKRPDLDAGRVTDQAKFSRHGSGLGHITPSCGAKISTGMGKMRLAPCGGLLVLMLLHCVSLDNCRRRGPDPDAGIFFELADTAQSRPPRQDCRPAAA